MGVDAHQLVAGEGAHLNLLAVHRVGGQLGGGVVFAPGLLRDLRVPGAADGGADGAVGDAGNDVGVRRADKGAVGRNVHDGLGHIGAGRLVPVADGVDPVVGQGGFQAGAGKEAVDVPAVVQRHVKGASGSRRGRQDAVHRLGVLGADHAAVIIQEVAVVRRHGVGVELAVHAGGLHRAFQVAALDVVGVQGDLLQSAGRHQLVELVVGKGKYIRRGGGVGQDVVLGVRLRAGADVDGDVALVGVLCNESVGHLAQHRLIFFGAPHGQGNVAPAGRLPGRVAAGGIGGCRAAVCRGGGAAARAAAAGGQRQRHDGGHSQAYLFFHSGLLLLCWLCCSVAQSCATHCTIIILQWCRQRLYSKSTVFFPWHCAICLYFGLFAFLVAQYSASVFPTPVQQKAPAGGGCPYCRKS